MRIYVHIPFCESKCSYCVFASFVGDANLQEKYFNKLLQEIKSYKTNEKVESIYFGGGTPSCVDKNFIGLLLDTIKMNFKIDKDAEITLEANPCSLSKEKLEYYKSIGINRISIGIQSLNNKVLKILGRRHNKKQALQSIKLALKAGFNNISADLLIGLKNSNIKKYASRLLKSKVKHISAYMLQLEEKAPLKSMVEKDRNILKNEDDCVKDYQTLVKFLQKKKMQRYEISNFAFDGYESQHNTGYWTGDRYVGFGLGAHSYDGNFIRTANASDFDGYFSGKKDKEILSSRERDEEIIMLGLRCKFGFKLSKLSFDLQGKKVFNDLVKQNVLIKEDDIVKLNPKYYEVSNTIIIKLLDD